MKFLKITISGKICTGKTTLFRNLQKKLNWPVFSTSQYFRDLAGKQKLSLEKAEEQNEKTTKKVDLRVRDLLKSKGNLIAEGWMTGIMANDYPCILKILLICDDKIRIKRFSIRENLDLKKAEKMIKDREENLLTKLSLIYKRNDFLDPKNYTLIVNTTNLTPDLAFKSILAKLA